MTQELIFKLTENEWLTSELKELLNKSNLVNKLFSNTLYGQIFTGKLVNQLCEYLQHQLKIYLKQEIQARIIEQGLDWQNEFLTTFEKMTNETFFSTKTNAHVKNKKWKHLKFKIETVQKFQEKIINDPKLLPLEILNLAKRHICLNKLHELEELLTKATCDFLSLNSKLCEKVQDCSRRNKEFSEKNLDSFKSSKKYSEIYNEYQIYRSKFNFP
jgi:hypothetical protein